VIHISAPICEACSLRPQCTESKNGREVLRYYEEDYVDLVKGYRGTFPYEKALRKRRVWGATVRRSQGLALSYWVWSLLP
jgi:hypothetical protein